jgi:predicted AAA+ superfamily ATPase
MKTPSLFPRYSQSRLTEALKDNPVVLVHGPRQCGKTTLTRMVGDKAGYAYFSFDEAVILKAAEADPTGFVLDLPERVILDEIQRAPGLFVAIKAAVDRHRIPGRFILTGSANVLLVPQLSDSLAGRMEILRLHPLTQSELARLQSRFLASLFADSFKTHSVERLGEELAARIVTGGYPAAQARSTPARCAAWYRDYVEALIQRDVSEMARISSLHVLPRLLSFAVGQTARLLNVCDLASPFQLSRPTIRDYMTLLERVFLLDILPPWHSNRLSRLIKTPKLHMGDTGVACALMGLDAHDLTKDRTVLGPLLETFVFQEVKRQAEWQDKPISFYHFRDKDGVEVDIVLERGAQEIAGIEVKASATVTAKDFSGLRKLRDVSGSRFLGGVVLYDGEQCVRFGDRLHAVPIRALWETT